MSTPLDPITTVYQRIRTVLLARYTAQSLVKPGNFYDLSDPKFQQVKPEVQPGDLPEVVLAQGAFTLRPFGTNSRVATVLQAFTVFVTVDKLQVTPVNALKYQALIALLQAGDDLGLTGLVRGYEINGGGDDMFGQQEWKRGTLRLVSAFNVQTQLDLDRRQLLAL